MRPTSRTERRVLTPGEFVEHCRQGEVLVTKNGEPALVAHTDADGRPLYTKIWQGRGLLTSDRLVPYYQRFRRALVTLAERGVPVPVYRAHGVVAGGPQRFVIYEPLAGVPLRQRTAYVDVEHLARFVCELHARGVYFRGLHLGNILQCPDSRFGLIDVQDIRFRSRPLGRASRERNLGILCSHPRDLAWMREGHWSELVLAYCRAAGWGVAAAAHMRHRVEMQVERRQARRAATRRRRGMAPLEVTRLRPPGQDRAES